MRAGGWAVGRAGVNISFPEHNSATSKNILMIIGSIIQQVNVDSRCKNDNSAYLGFLITLPLLSHICILFLACISVNI